MFSRFSVAQCYSSKMFRGVFLALIVYLALLDEGFGLNCLRCQSNDVESHCKLGKRNIHAAPKRISCYGKSARCYAIATVNETGEAFFERGCTIQNLCDDKENSDIEFCYTCQSKFCNYVVMQLDEEVESYLKEVREYEKSLLPTTTTTTTTTTTLSPSTRYYRKRHPHVKHGSSRQGLGSDDSPVMEKSVEVEDHSAIPENTKESDSVLVKSVVSNISNATDGKSIEAGQIPDDPQNSTHFWI